jgi:gamma-glutamyltranspeptidase/glutathione hydrolase
LSVAFLTPVIAVENDGGPLALAGAGAGGPDATAAILYEAAARSRHETPTPQSGAGPRLSINVIACEAGTCNAIPSPGSHGMAAIAGGE